MRRKIENMKSTNKPSRAEWFKTRKGNECECSVCEKWTLGRLDGRAICEKCVGGAK